MPPFVQSDYFSSGGALICSQKGFHQVAFSADDHRRKALEPFRRFSSAKKFFGFIGSRSHSRDLLYRPGQDCRNKSLEASIAAQRIKVIPPPLVRGEDLIALGLKPGPKFGEILEAAEMRQLEGTLRNRDEALEWVKREYSLGSD